MVRTELGFEGRVAVSLDLHGNVTRKMLAHADVITAFRTFPHTDQQATGRRAAALALQPDATTRAVAKLGMLLPPTATHDHAGDFARMQALARQAEEADDIDDVALLPVQPWLDIAEFGSAVVVTGRGDGPARAARRLAEDWYAHRARYPDGLVSMAAILQTLAVKAHRPWILADTADAITGGSSGRSAYVLQALLPHADAFCRAHSSPGCGSEDGGSGRGGTPPSVSGIRRCRCRQSRVRTAEGRYAPEGPQLSRHRNFDEGGGGYRDGQTSDGCGSGTHAGRHGPRLLRMRGARPGIGFRRSGEEPDRMDVGL